MALHWLPHHQLPLFACLFVYAAQVGVWHTIKPNSSLLGGVDQFGRAPRSIEWSRLQCPSVVAMVVVASEKSTKCEQ